ncbi:hypothetical protein [uncultured Mucilaginibacter sp.]|uniref:hypothetical protein n=1 Tax=uncultured Mucilaginibacter sp. TaxID=797541 RepID=UPI0025E81531|nr:hypothetical protein [uncultured Mucilaginibacter sp.]
MKSIEEIETDIMTMFATTNSKPGHVLSHRQLSAYIRDNLNPREQSLVDPAIDQLIERGYISVKNIRGADNLALTDTGYEFIYPIDNEDTISNIQERIMGQFRRLNYRVNNMIQMRWITQNLIPSLNQREREMVAEALQGLENLEYITYENRTVEGIVLTEQGFDYIYQ